MKFKKIILCFLILSILVCTCGCGLGHKEIVRDGVEYDKRRDNAGDYYLSVTSVGWDFTATDPFYIPPEIDGIPVKRVGNSGGIMADPTATIGGVEKLYFPWTIAVAPEHIRYINVGKSDENDVVHYKEVKYIISSSVKTLIDYEPRSDVIYAVPDTLYNDYKENGLQQRYNILPANIALMFNYDDNPNEGYFFVDLLEESGKIVKPPYNPKREGYKFAGWYKESECLNAWDFENDIVEINFDEEGERIYEEVCLYAKWEKK